MDCIFCRIVKKEAPAEIVFENDKVVVFKDIQPKAPIHLVIASKKHIPSVNHLTREDRELVAEMIFVAKEISKKFKEAENGYKLVFNVGKGGGQMIEHLHLHFLAGKVIQLP
jgi:histidine triad (HIT) family protein